MNKLFFNADNLSDAERTALSNLLTSPDPLDILIQREEQADEVFFEGLKQLIAERDERRAYSKITTH